MRSSCRAVCHSSQRSRSFSTIYPSSASPCSAASKLMLSGPSGLPAACQTSIRRYASTRSGGIPVQTSQLSRTERDARESADTRRPVSAGASAGGGLVSTTPIDTDGRLAPTWRAIRFAQANPTRPPPITSASKERSVKGAILAPVGSGGRRDPWSGEPTNASRPASCQRQEDPGHARSPGSQVARRTIAPTHR